MIIIRLTMKIDIKHEIYIQIDLNNCLRYFIWFSVMIPVDCGINDFYGIIIWYLFLSLVNGLDKSMHIP